MAVQRTTWMGRLTSTGQGQKGDPGTPGQPRFTGHGPPPSDLTAKPGDAYLDYDTGDVYELGS